MINWNASLRTKDGKIGLLLPPVPHELRRRVAMCRDGSRPPTDPKEQNQPGREMTTWLYGEDGIARCDGQPSDADLVNA